MGTFGTLSLNSLPWEVYVKYLPKFMHQGVSICITCMSLCAFAIYVKAVSLWFA